MAFDALADLSAGKQAIAQTLKSQACNVLLLGDSITQGNRGDRFYSGLLRSWDFGAGARSVFISHNTANNIGHLWNWSPTADTGGGVRTPQLVTGQVLGDHFHGLPFARIVDWAFDGDFTVGASDRYERFTLKPASFDLATVADWFTDSVLTYQLMYLFDSNPPSGAYLPSYDMGLGSGNGVLDPAGPFTFATDQQGVISDLAAQGGPTITLLGSGTQDATTSLTVSLTTVSGEGLLVAVITRDTGSVNPVTSVVFNGTEALSAVSSSAIDAVGWGQAGLGRLEWWWLADPTATTADIVLTVATNSNRLAFIAGSVAAGLAPTGAVTATEDATVTPDIDIAASVRSSMVVGALMVSLNNAPSAESDSELLARSISGTYLAVQRTVPNPDPAETHNFNWTISSADTIMSAVIIGPAVDQTGYNLIGSKHTIPTTSAAVMAATLRDDAGVIVAGTSRVAYCGGILKRSVGGVDIAVLAEASWQSLDWGVDVAADASNKRFTDEEMARFLDLIFPDKSKPLVVVWLEGDEGTALETYITNVDTRQDRFNTLWTALGGASIQHLLIGVYHGGSQENSERQNEAYWTVAESRTDTLYVNLYGLLGGILWDNTDTGGDQSAWATAHGWDAIVRNGDTVDASAEDYLASGIHPQSEEAAFFFMYVAWEKITAIASGGSALPLLGVG